MSDYNGWKNRETWNVALWIQNDQGLYNAAKNSANYGDFVRWVSCLNGLIAYETPDCVQWDSERLDVEALDKMMSDL